MRLRFSAVFLASGLFFFVSLAHAQITSVINETKTPVPGSGHDYIKLFSEMVNPANGSVSMRVGAPMPKQRGDVDHPFWLFSYDSPNVTVLGSFVSAVSGSDGPEITLDLDATSSSAGGINSYTGIFPGGFVSNEGVNFVNFGFATLTVNLPAGGPLTCQYSTGYTYTDDQGTVHTFPQLNWISQGSNGDCNAFNVHEGLTTEWDFERSQYVGILPNPANEGNGLPPPTLQFADAHGLLNGVSDTNGNTYQNFAQLATSGYTVTSVTLPWASKPFTYTYTTVSGNYTIGLTKLSSYNVGGCSLGGGLPTISFNNQALQTIGLPNGNGLEYQFFYGENNSDTSVHNPYGQINEVIYPNGGWVKYTWGMNSNSEVIGVTAPSGPHCEWTHDWPVITKRVVSFDGQTEALEQDFTYATQWGANSDKWTQKTTTVVTKDLLRSGQPSFSTVYTYTPFVVTSGPNGSFAGLAPQEQTVSHYDWGGNLLETESKSWVGEDLLGSECVTLSNGLTSGTFYAYQTFNNFPQVVKQKQWDYGLVTQAQCEQNTPPSTNATRETDFAYSSFGASSTWPYEPSLIYDRQSSAKTYGNGTELAETDFSYDQFAVSPVTANNHDETNYGPSSTNPRGNPTTVTMQCFVAGTACAQGNSVTTYTYDETGQPVTATDACGQGSGCSDMPVVPSNDHTTQYLWTDSFVSGDTNTNGVIPPSGNTNTYLTEIIYPIANGVSHAETFSYDYPSGQLTVAKDENGQVSRKTTSYSYNDPLARLTGTAYPDGGQTTASYNDATPSATTCKTVDTSGRTLCSTAIMDGIGHITQLQDTNDPQGADHTTTTFDGLGHAYTVTNPYRSTSDPTYGITTYTYDALGRTTRVLHPDGTSVQTTYSSRATEVTDEGNGTRPIQRIFQRDALGRLTGVCEVTATTVTGNSGTPSSCGLDIGATGFLTSYTYDALEDLLSVTQGGLNGRSYTYDSLSQLTTATNPESGTINFKYDGNGNVASKTAPQPNQTSNATVTTNYSYDALNRIVQMSHQNDPTGTPVANFVFDGCPTQPACPATPQNPIGRLVAAYNSNSQEFESYDLMGRVQDEWQCTSLNCTGTPWHLNNVYDLAGDPTSTTDGMGVTLTQTFDSAMRLSQVTSSWNDSQHPGTLLQGTCANGINSSGACYNALNTLTTASLGNGLVESAIYTNRARLQSETVSNGSGSTPATGLLTLNGSEQNYQTSATPSTATIDIASSCTTNCGSGTVSVTINGTKGTATWSSTLSSEASAIAAAASNTGLVSASSQNVTSGVWKAVLTSHADGTSADYSLSCSAGYLSVCPSSMTGGQNSNTVYDTGTITATVNGHADSVSYSSTSTPSSLASALATSIDNDSNASVTAVAGDEVISLTSKTSGAGANYAMIVNSQTNNPSHFSQPSFAMGDSGPSMIGGTGGYGFALAYSPNGSLVGANDSVNGDWIYAYDDFNRLISANNSAQNWAYTYNYDRYGNKWNQDLNGACTAGTSYCLTFDTNNRINNGAQTYDSAGNVIADSLHHYYYDAENRLIQIDGILGSCASPTTACYVYDAIGRRVQKTTVTGTVNYVYDIEGAQVAEVNSSGALNRAEVYAEGVHLATYASSTTYFDQNDWLSTERSRAGVNGSVCETITSLPFGDGMNTSGSCSDPSPIHLTGKQRDGESGNDYFGARYYGSSLGRWTNPDLPFADQDSDDPQSWNLYAYVRSNPLGNIDTNGRLTLLIGGTFSNPKDYEPDSDLGKEMAGLFGDEDVQQVGWSRGLGWGARAALARNIVNKVESHTFKPGERLNVVCHSHGCSGLMKALATLKADGYSVDNLVSLGEPMRIDYRFTPGSVRHWFNIYAPNDFVQRLGGLPPLFGGRTNSAAMNLSVNTGHNFWGAHGALHSDDYVRSLWENWILSGSMPSNSGGGNNAGVISAFQFWWQRIFNFFF